MSELSQHVKGWIEYLQDTRNQTADEFIHPIQRILKETDLNPEEKIEKIEQANARFIQAQSEWNPKEYGVNIP